MSTDPCNAKIVHRHDINPELSLFRIAPDSGPIAEFHPGQFATLGLPKPLEPGEAPAAKPKYVRRAYSIASSPKIRDYLEFFIVRVNEGKLTPRLWDLHEGDRIWLDPRINGEFTLETIPAGKDLIMVSTGTGLAPFMSMLNTYRGTGRWNRLVMIHGVRLAQDLGYKEELEAIAAADKSVIYIPATTREPEGSAWQGRRGRVNQFLEDAAYEQITGAKMDPKQCYVLLCGNPEMIEAARVSLEGRGFVTHTKKQVGNIHFERYW